MLNVINAECLKYALYAECQYAECQYAECHYAECCGAVEEGLSYTSMNILFFLYFPVVWHTSAVKFPRWCHFGLSYPVTLSGPIFCLR